MQYQINYAPIAGSCHRSAAEQLTSDCKFSPAATVLDNTNVADSCPWSRMSFRSPCRHLDFRNRVRCISGYLFPCLGTYNAYSLQGSLTGRRQM